MNVTDKITVKMLLRCRAAARVPLLVTYPPRCRAAARVPLPVTYQTKDNHNQMFIFRLFSYKNSH